MVAHIVVMGVSGSGKTTISEALAERLGYAFGEADEFHPASNVEKMGNGIPLTDADRWPWLQVLSDWIRANDVVGTGTLLACSALRRPYRQMLDAGIAEPNLYIHLDGSAELISARMAARSHFMPPSLLQSQILALEPLHEDERGVVLDLVNDPQTLIDQAMDWLCQQGVHPSL